MPQGDPKGHTFIPQEASRPTIHQHASSVTVRQLRKNGVHNSHQHPPIIMTIQRRSAWEGVHSPGPPEQTPRDAPPSRRAAHVRAHSYTPDSSSGSNHHVRAHTSRRHRKHRQPSEGATCAHIPPGGGGATRRHGPACNTAGLQTARLGGTRTTPRKGDLGERVIGVLETRI